MKKILIVEDEIAYSRILAAELSKENYDVISAKNGKEGLEYALANKPDLILLDIRMPVMDGTEMLKELRKSEFGSKVKVIMLTNLEPDQATIGNVIKDQPTYYLIKSDIRIEELKKMILDIFASKTEEAFSAKSNISKLGEEEKDEVLKAA